MFGYIRCSHCGTRLSFDDLCFLDKSLLCQECGKLGEGAICEDCFRYNLLSRMCSYDEMEHNPKGRCVITDVSCAINRRKPQTT